MADIGIKIPNLDQATVAAGEDLVVIVDVSADKTMKIAKSDFISDVGIALDSLSATTASASGTGSLTYNNTTGEFTYTPPEIPTDISDLTDNSSLLSGAATSALSNSTTSDIAEGSNLYFTVTRARQSLNEGTGVDINYTTGAISIGQAVYTNSNVTFNDLEINGTLRVNGQDLAQNVSNALTSLDTDDVPESPSPTNLYFTTARARASISDGTGVDYNPSTGVISIGQNVYTTSSPTFNNLTLNGELTVNGQTLGDILSSDISGAVGAIDTDAVSEGDNLYFTTARARDAFSNGTGVTINKTTGTISIGQAVNTTSNVLFNDGRFTGTLRVGNITDVEAALSAASSGIAAITTTAVAEGDNLYFTNGRARSAVSGGTGVSYNSSTGVISIGQAVETNSNVRFNNLILGGTLTVGGVNIADVLTGVQAQTSSLSTSSVAEGSRLYFTEARARGALAGGTGVSYDDVAGTISIGQDVNTNSNVRFNDARITGTLNVGVSNLDVEFWLNDTISKLNNLTTTSISEGTNEYFTTARARASVSAGTGVSYNSTTGTISIGQAVNTNSNVQFNNGDFGGDLTVDGTINGVQFPGTLAFPVGGIILWSGSIDTIPSGWALCNGSNGTPDLRGMFVVGAGTTVFGRGYDVGETGGANTVTLSTNEMPNHTHSAGTLATDTAGNHNHTVKGSTASNGPFANQKTAPQLYRDDAEVNAEDNNSIGFAGAHTHNISGTTGTAGGGQAHENRPPYYALAYIMKIA